MKKQKRILLDEMKLDCKMPEYHEDKSTFCCRSRQFFGDKE
jgi:hypothetical protein